MASLNTPGSGHGGKTEHYASGQTREFNTFPPMYRNMDKVARAMAILDRVAASEPAAGQCNAYFASLPGGHTFTDLWQSPATWVNYSSANRAGLFASTHSNKRDMTLHEWCLSTQNRWMIAACLCHELAHVGGAPGGRSHEAERAVDKCYFPDQYDPNILGRRENLAGYFERAYA